MPLNISYHKISIKQLILLSFSVDILPNILTTFSPRPKEIGRGKVTMYSVRFLGHLKVGEVADLFKGIESTVLYSRRQVVISCTAEFSTTLLSLISCKCCSNRGKYCRKLVCDITQRHTPFCFAVR